MPELLVTCRDRQAVLRHYLPAVRQGGWTGGICLVAAGENPPDAAVFRGLLLIGGGDTHPRHWDPTEPVHPTAEPDAERDELEHPLVRAAWTAGRPILGICRGIQTLNVALGGGLIQDIPSWFGCPPERHRQGSADDPVLCHHVAIAPDSRLSAQLRSVAVPVNSRHHQAVRQVAADLRAVAWDPATQKHDGRLVEGLEATDPERWVVGVQWHPENLVRLPGPAGDAARSLFRAFAQALE